ncbi:hypothetical protein KIKIMORA_00050 [Brevundimonas phage vB_BpoS-Kikimora]|uniref:Uncharacterized protein n=1 Tax=Brevundimonas phage vB_BpoS-Kikimora TaxID=2948601 RepID=A0A9E7MSA5_9CAUD|nr:hypothetical protein KIKIMORA_00050 [Brevundimonas phage vB_BpoS-Kikimora]
MRTYVFQLEADAGMPVAASNAISTPTLALRANLERSLPLEMKSTRIILPMAVFRLKTQVRVEAESAQAAKAIIRNWADNVYLTHVQLELVEIAS